MTSEDVTLIAVSYFGADDAFALLESLLAQDEKKWTLLIVDNTDDSTQRARLDELRAVDSRVDVMRAPGNLGYLGGAAWALEQRPPAGDAAVLNTDLVLMGPGALRQLAQAARAGSDIGMIAPSVISERSGRDQNPHLAAPPSVRISVLRALSMSTPLLAQSTIYASTLLSRKSEARRVPDKAESRAEIYAPHGSFLYFTAEYLRRGGSLRHPLFLFAEEVFVAEECLNAGLKVLFEPSIKILHREHANTGVRRPRLLLKASGRATRYVLSTAWTRRRRMRATQQQIQRIGGISS